MLGCHVTRLWRSGLFSPLSTVDSDTWFLRRPKAQSLFLSVFSVPEPVPSAVEGW